MGRFLLVLCLVLFVVPQTSLARTWYILPDSTGDAPTIKDGLIMASYGDDVLVAPGTYYEYGLVMKSGVWLHSEWGPEVTVIDAQEQGNVISCDGISASSTIEGFTITGGIPTGAFKAGIHCDESDPLIKDNVIRDNDGERGCGIYCRSNSSPTILENEILNNIATGYGGGIFLDSNCSPTIHDNLISGNHAGSAGGGVHCASSSSAPTISENEISLNSTEYHGAGVYIMCPATIRGNEIQSNTATQNGGGVFIRGNHNAVVDSNEFFDNSASLGGGLYCEHSAGGHVEITENDFDSNTASKGGGVYCEEASPTISWNRFAWNEAVNWGGSVYCYSDSAEVIGNLIVGSTSGIYGGGIALYSAYSGDVIGNTIVNSSAPYGGGISCQFGAAARISSNIIAVSSSGAGIYCHSADPALSCNDIWANSGGDSICGIDMGGNFSLDPYFCDSVGGDYSLDAASPCAPENSPVGCGLIGALPVSCDLAGVSSRQTEPTTWGSIKSMYR